MPLYQ